MNDIISWAIFGALAVIAVVMAASMLVTMSMYRAGLALMASFVALAGVFVLLDADLLAAMQVMMNVGGMLIMVLFMVMLMLDPGGEMMWDMKRSMRMRGVGAFSMAMPRSRPATRQMKSSSTSEQPMKMDTPQEYEQRYTCPMHPEVRQDHPGKCPKCGMDLIPQQTSEHQPASHECYTCPMHPEVQQDHLGKCPKCGMDLVPQQADSVMSSAMGNTDHSAMALPAMDHNAMGMGGMNPQQERQMMVDMAMSTAQLPWALVLGAVTAIVLIALVVLTPWPVSGAVPTRDASDTVGILLLGRYMVGFEGAGFLIVAGIAGAVILGRREGLPWQPTAPAHISGAQDKEAQMYACPMHLEVQQDHPGQCPKCGMNLIPASDRGQRDGGVL